MESTEILQEIIDAEKAASKIFDEAAALRDGLSARIARGQDRLNLIYADKVKEAAEEAEKTEAARADAEIARNNAETDARLAALRDGFEKARAGYADTLFKLVIGETNG